MTPSPRSKRVAAILATFFLAALSACTAAQNASTSAAPQQSAPAPPDQPAPSMAPFARMIPGEWTMTVASGTSSFRTWHWGPGRHSMRVMTDGLDASGNPWRDLDVFYWHPGRREVRQFGVSQFARGITEGTITFDGETAQSDFDLYQTGGRRRLRLLWEFDGPDKYRATLMEAGPPGTTQYATLVAWDLLRTQPPTPPRPLAVEGATEPSDLLSPLKPLLGTWESNLDAPTAGAFHTQSTFQWIPLADAIYAQVLAPGKEGQPAHVLDVYLYHHTGANALRCLALSGRGGVYEGDISVPDGEEGRALQLELQGQEGERAIPCVVRLDFAKDTLRYRVWSIQGTSRTLTLDTHHQKLRPSQD